MTTPTQAKPSLPFILFINVAWFALYAPLSIWLFNTSYETLFGRLYFLLLGIVLCWLYLRDKPAFYIHKRED